jgi:putative MFS transporter
VRVETLKDRRAPWAFGAGVLAVVAGVLLHLPMFWMGRMNGFRLAGMPMDPGMTFGMLLIVGGIFVAAYGLLPTRVIGQARAAGRIAIQAPEDAPLRSAHWTLMAVLVVALAIDVMKPASLGFVMPGMTREYGVSAAQASLVPFFALVGTVIGSLVWGVIADLYGRKASILLSAVVFVGSSICGVMPSLAWNIAMCFLMGAGAGGMLPVAYALLAETMPTRRRGWVLVLVGGLGAVGGYFAASGASALLVPTYGWRVLWLLNLPTGLALVLMSGLIPESAKFLLARGREAAALQVMARFGAVSRGPRKDEEDPAEAIGHGLGSVHRPRPARLWTAALIGRTAALSIAAVVWGLVNFGVLLWLPSDLVAKGYSIGASSRLLAQSALIAFPTVFACAALYSRWSTKWSLALTLALTLGGLVWVLLLEARAGGDPVAPVAMLIVGSNGLLAILLPYAAESYPLRIRGRATGLVAAGAKTGGVCAQALCIAALAPPLGLAALAVAVPTALALALVARFGVETRALDLRSLEFDDPVLSPLPRRA